MKKIVVLLLFTIVLFTNVAFSNEEVIAPSWYEIIPTEADYQYIEPIKRPKWAYPLAWTGFFCTLGIIPVAPIMKNKDIKISTNNDFFYKYDRLKQQFEADIEQCNNIYKKPTELASCYMQVKYNYQSLVNNTVAFDKQNALLRQQTQLQQLQTLQNAQMINNQNRQLQLQQNNNTILNNINAQQYSPQTYRSTLTPVGNTLYVNTRRY